MTTTAIAASTIGHQASLAGQTVVVIGGSAAIGLETAREARAEGADIILTGRNADALDRAAGELGAQRTAAFDATDPAALDRFFEGLPDRIEHVMVTAGRLYYAPLAELNRDLARREFDEHQWLAIALAALAVHLMTNTAITGATFDIDGGQQLIAR